MYYLTGIFEGHGVDCWGLLCSINATVIGSKQADGEGAENGEEKKDEDEGAVAEEKVASDAEKNE